jgi:hypothetical protein
MGLFDGMFSGGGFDPQAASGGAPMAINQDGASGQSPFSGLFGGGQNQGGMFGQGGGLMGLGFGGQSNQPLMNMGGQGQGLLGFGSPGQGGMNPMMRFGMGMAGMPQQQQPGIPPGGFNPHRLY